MAITSAICNSFKQEVLQAIHNFTASSGNTFNLALYTSSATLNKSTTAYTTSNEISNTSGSAYTAKGKALTSVTSASFTANGCLIFNDSASGDPAVCAIAFGSDKTVTSGTFTIQFPTADASNAIIRIA